MKDGNVIEVNGVYKKFKNYADKSHNLKEKALNRARNKYEENWVLRGINFEVKRGEAIGLIGCNGCGKSTTLKLLTRIIYPDKGNIEIKGRVSSLLELGAGFHPDLSGRENIYLNAAVFGLTRKEIDKRVDEIILFSELGEYINNPIRTYSSGMYMKLAFSVAINVNADILLIDEILGVGDVSFQKKCFEKLVEIKERGTTIVIVSHSTDQIERICDRSIWIEKGLIREEGAPREIHKKYLDVMEERRLVRKEVEAEERRKQVENAERLKKEAEKQKQQRKEERRKQQELLEQQMAGSKSLEELQKEQAIEDEKQKALEQRAAQEREKQAEVVNRQIDAEASGEVRRLEFLKKEVDRLELVVAEKNFEIERLDSVVRQKELALQKAVNDKNEEVLRLERIITEKEDEIDRLNETIIEKNEEIDRANVRILELDAKLQEQLSDD